jgi:hypothetical protein
VAIQSAPGFESLRVQRKIYFYRAYAGRLPAGQPQYFDPAPILKTLDEIPPKDSRWYTLDEYGHEIRCWVDRLSPCPEIRFGRIRRSAPPQVEYQGAVSDLRLQPGRGLLEPAHIVFFPEGVVGCELNTFAPRVTRLAEYLQQTASCPAIKFGKLLQPDIAERLERLQDVTLFRLKVNAAYLRELVQLKEFREANDPEGFLNHAVQFGNGQIVEVILRPRPRSRESLEQRLVNVARGVMNYVDPPLRTQGVARWPD